MLLPIRIQGDDSQEIIAEQEMDDVLDVEEAKQILNSRDALRLASKYKASRYLRPEKR